MCDVLIRQADEEDKSREPVVQTASHSDVQPRGSVADELTKLSMLRKEGILSDQEFEDQKNKLLT